MHPSRPSREASQFTTLLKDIINNSRKYSTALAKAAGPHRTLKTAFNAEVKAIAELICDVRARNDLPVRAYYMEALAGKLWHCGKWNQISRKKHSGNMGPKTSPTRLIFRIINESRATCVRLACAAYATPGAASPLRDGNPSKEAFYDVIETVVAEIKRQHEIEGSVAMGSLRSNQWRYGKWQRITPDERTADNYFALSQAERDNPTINPDEAKEQEKREIQAERFSSNRHTTSHRDMIKQKRATTDTIEEVINGNKDYCMRLRNAAGKEMRAKHDFHTEATKIFDELAHKPMYTLTLITRLWKRGQWKQYIFEAPSDDRVVSRNTIYDLVNKSDLYNRRLCQAAGPAQTRRTGAFDEELTNIISDICYANQIGYEDTDTPSLKTDIWFTGAWGNLKFEEPRTRNHDDRMDALRFEYMNFPPHGKSVTASQHMLNAYRGKAADYIIIDDKIADAPSMDPKLLEYVRKQLHKTKLSMDFAALEERVAIETGCTPKELVNQTNRSVTCPAALGLAYGGARSGRWNAGCYAKREHSLFAHQTDMMKQMLKYKAPKPQPKEEVPMKIVNQTLINDRPLDTYSNSELIDNISRLEGKNKELEKLETKSEHISDQIETNTLNCKKLAGFLDARS